MNTKSDCRTGQKEWSRGRKRFADAWQNVVPVLLAGGIFLSLGNGQCQGQELSWRDGVVKVELLDPAGQNIKQGTGLIYLVSDQEVIIVTSQHNIGSNVEGVTVKVHFHENRADPKKRVNAAIIPMKTDVNRDISILAVSRKDAPANLAPMNLGTSANLKEDASVNLIGQPVNQDQGWVYDNLAKMKEDASDVLKFSSALISKGFSGGPLMDAKHNVVGLIQFADVDGAQSGSAIPIETVKEFLDRVPRFKRGVQLNADLILGLDYGFGINRPIDAKKAKQHIEAGAKSGDLLSKAWQAYLTARGTCGYKADWKAGIGTLNPMIPELEALGQQGVGSADFLVAYTRYSGSTGTRDLSGAFKAMEAAAANGFQPARINLSNFYFRGFTLPPDAAMAAKILTDSPQMLSSEKVQLASIYLAGQGGGDIAKAVKLLDESVNAGDPGAMIMLGRIYLYGEGVEQDIGKAKNLFSRALQAGDGRGRLSLAQTALWENDTPTAVNLIQEEVDGYNSSNAKLFLSRLIASGTYPGGVDVARVFQLTEEAMNSGNDDAMLALAGYYLSGSFAGQDVAKGNAMLQTCIRLGVAGAWAVDGQRYANMGNMPAAFQSFQKSANLNEENGMYGLGVMYLFGQVPGEPENPKKALQLFLKAGSRGLSSGYTMAGYMYLNGSSATPRDRAQAEAYFFKALQFNDPGALEALLSLYLSDPNFLKAAPNLNKVRNLLESKEDDKNWDAKALLGMLDLMTNQNHANAVQRIEKSAKEKSAIGSDLLADIYIRGIMGKARDLDKAEALVKPLAEKGFTMSMVRLGYIRWTQGKQEEARKLWDRASQQKSRDGSYYMAIMYLYGQGGMGKDTAKGMELLQRAANSGHVGAQMLMASGVANSPMPPIWPPSAR